MTGTTGLLSFVLQDDDGTGWVNPENYSEQKSAGLSMSRTPQQTVATTDDLLAFQPAGAFVYEYVCMLIHGRSRPESDI